MRAGAAERGRAKAPPDWSRRGMQCAELEPSGRARRAPGTPGARALQGDSQALQASAAVRPPWKSSSRRTERAGAFPRGTGAMAQRDGRAGPERHEAPAALHSSSASCAGESSRSGAPEEVRGAARGGGNRPAGDDEPDRSPRPARTRRRAGRPPHVGRRPARTAPVATTPLRAPAGVRRRARRARSRTSACAADQSRPYAAASRQRVTSPPRPSSAAPAIAAALSEEGNRGRAPSWPGRWPLRRRGLREIVPSFKVPPRIPWCACRARGALPSAGRSRTALELAAVDGSAAVRRRARRSGRRGQDDLVSRFAADPDESVRAAVTPRGPRRCSRSAGQGVARPQPIAGPAPAAAAPDPVEQRCGGWCSKSPR